MFVQWRSKGENAVKSTPVDMDEADRLTHDGTDKASTVAKMLFDANRLIIPEWADLKEGRGPTIEILEPERFAGTYAISVSIRTRGGVTRVGTAAHPIIVTSSAERERSMRLLEGATAPEDIEVAYSFLGNIYGHQIDGALDEKESKEIDVLRTLYDNATLHGLGFPVRSKVRNAIGFLAVTRLEDDAQWPDEDALQAFADSHGVVPQKASRWAGETVVSLVGFVPMSRIGEAQLIAYALSDIAEPSSRTSPSA